MFRIAICDDDKDFCLILENMVFDVEKKCGISFEVDLYDTGESLCKRLELSEKYDVLFLDIELITISGAEIGQIIRNKNDDNEIQIIYISGKTEYAMELFKSRPLDFLVKPFAYNQVEKALLTAVKLFELKTRYITFTVNRQTVRVSLSSIMYFESDKKKLKVITKDQKYEFYGSIEKIKEQLSSRDFLELHKSIVINYNYVKKYTSDCVIMINECTLPISRSRKKEVKKWLINRKEDDIVVG